MRHLTASLSCSPDVLLLSRRFCDIRFLHAVCGIYSFREVKIDAERRGDTYSEMELYLKLHGICTFTLV